MHNTELSVEGLMFEVNNRIERKLVFAINYHKILEDFLAIRISRETGKSDGKN
jgi:hypothetical protein